MYILSKIFDEIQIMFQIFKNFKILKTINDFKFFFERYQF